MMGEEEKQQQPPLMAKEMDVNSWWEIERSHPPGTLWMGATPLFEVCIETYGWPEEKAYRVLKGYRQFMTLQRRLGNSHVLEPSNIIDQMWVQHVSSRNYDMDCQLLCGDKVVRDGYSRLNHVSRAKRIETTQHLLRALFPNDLDQEIWFFGKHSMDSLIVQEKTQNPPEEECKILFRTHTFRMVLAEADIDVPMSYPFCVAACLYASSQGREYRDLRFIVEGVDVDPHQMLKELNFQDRQVVDVLVKEDIRVPLEP